MHRFLTSSSIGLLVLIYMYTDGLVPNSGTIPVLSFLMSYLLPLKPFSRSPHPDDVSETVNVVPIRDFETALAGLPSVKPGRTVWDMLVHRLWVIDCIDTLHELFEGLPPLVAKTREKQRRDLRRGILPPKDQMILSRSSPLGQFVRRAQVEFTRLQFHDAVALWKSFVEFRLPTRHLWARRNSKATTESFIDINLQELEADLGCALANAAYGDVQLTFNAGHISTHEIERLLEFQVGEMQRLGGRLPDEMRTRLRDLIQMRVIVPSVSHYIKFLDSWKAGDYASSFDNLHRYFDYTMQNRDRMFYQYALLNLAVLQADFGCHREAVSAMQEAISTAREHKDMNCLNFCLSWIYHFGKAYPSETDEIHKSGMLGSEKEGLNFLKSKAKESEMWSLLSTCLLSEAKLGLQNGDSVALVFENIVKASHLAITKNLQSINGSILMMLSLVFTRLGVSHLSWSHADAFLTCYKEDIMEEDVLRCNCWMASLLVQKGRYKDAISRMEAASAGTVRNLKYHQLWTCFSGLLRLKRHLYRDNMPAASHLLSQLRASAPPDPEISFVLSLLQIEYLIRTSDYSEALAFLESTTTASSSSFHQTIPELYAQIRLLNLKARIFERTHQSPKAFSIAMRAASLSFEARLLPALWESITSLAVVLISLDEFTAAAQMLEAILPQVLECEDCELAGRAFAALVDANMGLAGDAQASLASLSGSSFSSVNLSGSSSSAQKRKKEYMAKAVQYLDVAFGEFERLEDVQGMCECLAKKATALHLLGELALANDVSAKYLSVKERARVERE